MEKEQAHDSEVEKLKEQIDAMQKAADEQAEAVEVQAVAADRVKSQAKALQEELQQAHTAGATTLQSDPIKQLISETYYLLALRFTVSLVALFTAGFRLILCVHCMIAY